MRVLKFIFQTISPYRLYIGGIFIAMCVVALATVFRSFLVKQLIDAVSGKIEANLWVIFAYYGILQATLISVWTMSDYCITCYTAKFRIDVAVRFMSRLYDYSYSFFQNYLSGSLASKINDAFQHLPHLIFILINPISYSLLSIILSLIFLVSVSPIFAISMVLWISIFSITTMPAMKNHIVLNKKYATEKSNIIGLITDYLTNMISVKKFATRDFELERLSKLKKPFVEISESGGFFITWLYAFLNIFTSLYILGFIAFLIFGYQKGQISPGDFALVFMINFNIMDTMYHLSQILRDFVSNWGAVDQALLLLEEIPDIVDKPAALPLEVSKAEIVFESVKFHYKGTEPLFQNKSVSISSGQKIGLVGYSGGGKSTFVNLILRFYDVTSGEIRIDGQNIREVTQDSLRQNIALIPQDPALFHRSLMDNIRYGKTNATDLDVIQAAKKAHAHEFISKLPQGYDSLVGERGVKLSGGQRQRIAIARAILKDAPILILDEATSQLDSVTEMAIQASLWELMQNKTTIVVAHRLSTLLHMDRIIVFDHGRIVEDGTHEELLVQNGLYKILWEAQIGGFLPDQSV